MSNVGFRRFWGKTGADSNILAIRARDTGSDQCYIDCRLVDGGGQTIFNYQSGGWRYYSYPLNGTPPANWYKESFDDSAWSIGQAAFASGGYCDIQVNKKTNWSIDTEILIRKTVSLPVYSKNATLYIAVDDDCEVYWRDQLISGGFVGAYGCAIEDEFTVSVPSTFVSNEGTYNFPGNRGATYLWAAELTGSNLSIPTFYGGLSRQSSSVFSPGNISALSGTTIAATEFESTTANAGTGWSVADQVTRVGSGGLHAAVLVNTGSGSLGNPASFSSSTSWSGGWVNIPGGTIRQTVTYNPSLTGDPIGVSFPLTPLLGSLIVVFRAAGTYWGSGLNLNLPSGFTQLGRYVLGEDLGNEIDQEFSAHLIPGASGVTSSALAEGWGQETPSIETVNNVRYFYTSAPVARGTLAVYDNNGRLMYPNRGYKYADSSGKKFQLLDSSVSSIKLVTYLTTNNEFIASYPSKRITNASVYADRIRMNDVKGL